MIQYTDFKNSLVIQLKETIIALYGDCNHHIDISYHDKEGYGDFTTTIAFLLKKEGSPYQTAVAIADYFNSHYHMVTLKEENPGYLNMHLSFPMRKKLLSQLAYDLDLTYLKNELILKKLHQQQELIKEIEYLQHRFDWVLELYEKEGVTIDFNQLKQQHMGEGLEEKIVKSLLQFCEILIGQEALNGVDLLEWLRGASWKLSKLNTEMVIRHLHESKRNFILIIFLIYRNIFKGIIRLLL